MTETVAVQPAGRLAGTIHVPSDKSIAQRALILSALATGTSTVTLREAGEDVRSTAAALAGLGVSVSQSKLTAEGLLELTVAGAADKAGRGRLEGDTWCGNSGTAMRLLAGAVAGSGGRSELTGDASLSRRPMERVAAPLRAMGARVSTTDGHAPLTVSGSRSLRALEHQLPVASAQVLGAISMAALAAEGTTTILSPGPTRDHSERMLRAMGARVTREDLGNGSGTRTTIEGPATLTARPWLVPGDLSSAAVWVVAATIAPDANVFLPGVGLNPSRTAVLQVLREMGANIEVRPRTPGGVMSPGDEEPTADIAVRSVSRLHGLRIDADRAAGMIDELPLLAVAMAAAEGTSEVHGAAELRVKESDRVAAMAAALAATGADVEELPDGWRIRRGRPRRALVATHGDHRIAMAMAIAAWTGLAEEVILDDAACVAISYPGFWRDAGILGAIGAGVAT